MTHYLKVSLYFNDQDEYQGYNITDGGFEPPKAKIQRRRAHYKGGMKHKAFVVYMEDTGLYSDKYAEKALTLFHEFKDNGGFMYGRLDCKKEDRYGNCSGDII